jgi:hypothetical protein
MMTSTEVERARAVLAHVDYPNYTIHVGAFCGRLYLFADYIERDIVTDVPTKQSTREWLLPENPVPSAIVQTALKCILTSAEHRVRENFRYKGKRVFGPHINVETLAELVGKREHLDYGEDDNAAHAE